MKRVGIIGAGSIARTHARCWQQLPVELVGHYDLFPEAAQRAAEQFGGQAYSTLEALLADVDLVDVCTPATAHKAPVLAAAAAGKAITCEKPLARHLADCQEMIDACDAAGVPLFVAHVVRFFPQFAQAKAVIESGAIGVPGVIRTTRAGSFPRMGGSAAAARYGDFAQSGGVILDVSIHDIDFQRWCMGEVERVFARGLTFSDAGERDHALITLRFESGAVGHIEGSWAHTPGQFRTRLEIAGVEGLLEWDSADPGPIQLALLAEDGAVTRSSESPLAEEDFPYYAELAHFLDCVESGQPLTVTPHDALMAVKVSLAAIESVRTGQPVTIADFQEVPA